MKKTAMKKKHGLSSFLFVALLLAGLGVMLYPTMSDLYARYQMSREMAKYQQVVESGHALEDSLFAEAEEYNRYLAQKEDQFRLEPGELERIKSLLNPLGNHMMGIVSIPKIGEELPVYQGIEEKQLQSGAGWFYGSSLPAGGESTHCVITAHNGLVKARLFTDIDKLKKGDRFYMKVMSREMAYEVDQILVAEPEDFSALTIIPGEDLITLYTCTPYGVNTHRLLVRGRRTKGLSGGIPAEGGLSGRPALLLDILLAVAVLELVVIAVLIHRLYKKQRRSMPEKPGTPSGGERIETNGKKGV